MPFKKYYGIYFYLLVCIVISCNSKDSNAPEPTPTPSPNTTTTFKNPIKNSAPDPWVTQIQDAYYLMYTTGNNLTLLKTKKMSEVGSAESKVIYTPPSTGLNSQHIWAPEIHYINNKWYVYYSASDSNMDNHRMWVLENESSDPFTGEWIDKGKLALPDNKWAIDGTVAKIKGELYYAWSGWETNTNTEQYIYLAKMDSPTSVTGNRINIIQPVESWESNNTNPKVTEAPQFLITDSKVFICYSAGACWTDGYALGLSWCSLNNDLLNPNNWTKFSENPVFSTNVASNAFGPGHNSFFKSLDGKEDWILYHANAQSNQGCADKRSMRMQKITWSSEGIPIFGDPKPLNKLLDKPSGE